MTGSLDVERARMHQDAVNAWVKRHAPVDAAHFTVQLDPETWWTLSALAEESRLTIAATIRDLASQAAS